MKMKRQEMLEKSFKEMLENSDKTEEYFMLFLMASIADSLAVIADRLAEKEPEHDQGIYTAEDLGIREEVVKE